MTENIEIYGMHACVHALKNKNREIIKIFVTENANQRLRTEIEHTKINPEIVSVKFIDKMLLDNAVHQGVVVVAKELPKKQIMDIDTKKNILLFDQIVDPRNLGAIIRIAAAFSIEDIIITKQFKPKDISLIAKASSGGLEYVSLIEVTNLSRTIEQVKEIGYWVAGLDSDAIFDIQELKDSKKVAIIMGEEGKGLRRLTREKCDQMYKIKTLGKITSLNVSTAAAIALYSL
jgi:23S rRNA (guanosine2251-2'-O)-methyltransferase